MDVPPINLFARTLDPSGVRSIVLGEFPDAEIEESGGGWNAISITRKRGIFKKSQSLRIRHDPDFYSGSEWATQRTGMLGYFLRFPLTDDRRETLQNVIGEFQFSLAFVTDPPVSPGDDDFRYDLILKIAKHLGACFFLPGYLLDSDGRVLVSSDGEFDPGAIFPSTNARISPTAPAAPAEVDLENPAGEVPDPPTAERVAARAMVLAAVSARGLMELNASEQGADITELESTRKEVLTWCAALEIDEEIEPDERRVLESPLGSLDERDHLDSIWRIEGLSVLAWALGLLPPPEYDEAVKPDTLLPAVEFLNTAAASAILHNPVLRPSSELEQFADQLFAYHWRLRNFGIEPTGMDFKEFGKTSWFGPLDLSWARFDDGDLALGGTAIQKADTEIIATCSSIATERHLASNWLCGQSRIYSETDTPT